MGIMRLINMGIIVPLIMTNFAMAGTEELCADKWPNDYRMRNYCQDQQNGGNQELFSIARSKGLVKDGRLSASPNGGDYEKIIYQCMSKWESVRFDTFDYRMVVYCINQQFEAYAKTGAGTEKSNNTGIEGFCANKWPNDYRMRDYCQKQQSEGNQELFAIAEAAGLVKNGTLSTSPQGGKTERIINHCMRKWEKSKFKTFDYRMIVYCIKNYGSPTN